MNRLSVLDTPHRTRRVAQICLPFMLIVAGCGGGGGSGADPISSPVPSPAPDPSAASPQTFLVRDSASITADTYCAETPAGGSVCASFDDKTEINLDGIPFDRAHLADASRAGSIATASGSTTTGLAALDFERVATGAIETVDVAHARFRILGQRVYVTRATNIDGSTLDSLAPGDRVSVNGYFGPSGDLTATAVHREPSGSAFTLRGILELGPTGSVRVGGTAFGDLTDIVVLDFPSAPASGDAVLITGPLSASAPLTAASMRYVGGHWGEGNEDVRVLAGTITRRSHADDLVVEGHEVDCAVYPCSSLGNVGAGRLARVSRLGTAKEVAAFGTSLPFVEYSIVGPVDTIDGANHALTVLGFAVQRTPATQLVDATGQSIDLRDIRLGETVFASGGNVGNVMVANQVALSERAPTLSFWTSSRIASLQGDTITVLGTPIRYDATTPFMNRSCAPTLGDALHTRFTSIRIELSRTSAGDLLALRIESTTTRGACL